MDENEKHLARVLFHKKVYTSEGQQFEDLLCRIMELNDGRFSRVKPHGKIGDKKNDGYIQDLGIYFQIFSPEDPMSAASITTAVEKAKTDFLGLKQYWDSISPIKQFYFAYNDKYKGAYPDIEKALADIRLTHSLDRAGLFRAKDLEDIFINLPKQHIIEVVGLLPNPFSITSISYSALHELLGYIHGNYSALDLNAISPPPIFHTKIGFNKISPTIESLLNVGSFQAGLIDSYFQSNSTFSKDSTRDHLAGLYAIAKKNTSANASRPEYPGDDIFIKLLEDLKANSGPEIQNSAIVLLSYFFESCDIFEAPI